jgi:hypothetical protein
VGSLEERDAALELLRGDAQAEPRDELGIGSLRDAISDALFPGVTTLQTRAKYFLFVPAMYQALERSRSGVAGNRRIRALEDDLLQRLRGSAEQGIIGSRSWRVPQNPASGIYWTGLHTWRIRRFSDTRSRYHGWLDRGARAPRLGLSEDDTDASQPNWADLPDAEDLLESVTLDLNNAQAAFLQDRILAIRDRPERPLLKDLASPSRSVPATEAFWDLPAARRAALAELVADAAALSAAMYGAMLVYNLGCARLKESQAQELWADRLREWSRRHPPSSWHDWNLEEFWSRIRRLDAGRAEIWTRRFVDSWVVELRKRPPKSAAERLVREREIAVKPGRARLAEAPTLAGWTANGVGVEPLSFRWNQARQILRDIHRGLKEA